VAISTATSVDDNHRYRYQLPCDLIAMSLLTGAVQQRPDTTLLHDYTVITRISTNTITGHLWTTGFSKGDLKTPLFGDVVPTLEDWKTAGKTLAIFSSGSVQAQLQFFSYVRDGQSTKDIKHLFFAHYDTVNAGPKLEKTSYEKICREMSGDVSKVSFLTDNVKGMSALYCT
jgi:enolase-phosphatase E1